jgi:hypothetical protein
MRVLEAKEPGLLEIETSLVSEPTEWVQDSSGIRDPFAAKPPGFVPMERVVIAHVRDLSGSAEEKHAIMVRARAHLGGFRDPGVAGENGTTIARFRLLPEGDLS